MKDFINFMNKWIFPVILCVSVCIIITLCVVMQCCSVSEYPQQPIAVEMNLKISIDTVPIELILRDSICIEHNLKKDTVRVNVDIPDITKK